MANDPWKGEFGLIAIARQTHSMIVYLFGENDMTDPTIAVEMIIVTGGIYMVTIKKRRSCFIRWG